MFVRPTDIFSLIQITMLNKSKEIVMVPAPPATSSKLVAHIMKGVRGFL